MAACQDEGRRFEPGVPLQRFEGPVTVLRHRRRAAPVRGGRCARGLDRERAQTAWAQDALRGCSAPCAGVAKPAVRPAGAVAGLRPRDRSSSTALMSAPARRTIAEIHIHISITIAPPMAPYVLLYSPKCRT